MAKERQDIVLQKPLHGQFLKHFSKPYVDKHLSLNWLSSSGLKGETESLIIAAQDQALSTRYYQKNILKQNVDSKCRKCGNCEEHISHIISGCSILAPSEYLFRHNKVASFIHWMICKHNQIEVSDKWYEHQPLKAVTTNDITVMYDMAVFTDKLIKANRPDIIYHNKAENMCLLIDVSIPDDNNLMSKEAEKLSKYKDLELEIRKMWNTKTRVVPVVVGALGLLKNGFEKNIEFIPGLTKKNITDLQKITLLGTANILTNFLDVNV